MRDIARAPAGVDKILDPVVEILAAVKGYRLTSGRTGLADEKHEFAENGEFKLQLDAVHDSFVCGLDDVQIGKLDGKK